MFWEAEDASLAAGALPLLLLLQPLLFQRQ